MQLAHVLGTAIATVKHRSLSGTKLLVVQPLLRDRTSPDGDPQLAIDTIAAGPGDLVMITSDGRLLRDILKTDATPARYSTIALVDDVTTFSARKPTA
ncbi:MAG: ethanolamine utilization protein EutN [Planctomycetota bacterium]|nr:MAG: ethanolamine utilization protein EutN [Planctomycetota bacterium]